MNNLIEGFTQWLTEEGRAAKTVESYTSDIRKYHQFLERRLFQ